jgi:hypothetical protein
VRSVGEHTAKMTSYKKSFLSIAVFAMDPNLAFSGIAFADDQNGLYSHSHETALWDHSLICRDHRCAPVEVSVNPTPVVPVRGH